MAKENIFDFIKFKFYTLSNGLRVIIVPLVKIPLVCINLFYKVGSKDEQIGKSGFAHLFEHLMFQGTGNVPNGEFDRLCSLAGGVNNAMTSYDYTAYEMILPSNQLELGLWLESDRMFNLLVDEDKFEVQRKVVIEEIKETIYNQPYGKWREFLAENAFVPESGYAWEVHGKIQDLKTAKLNDAIDFYERFYRPDNCCLVIAGDVDIRITKNLIRKYFDHERNIKTPMPQKKQFKDNYKKSHLRYNYKDNVPHSGVFKSYHIPGLVSEDIYCAELVSSIIGWGASSRIQEELVHNKGIASHAGSFIDKRENSSLLTIYAIANNQKISTEYLFDEISDLTQRFKKNPVMLYELIKAQNQVKTQLAFALQYISGIAGIIGLNTIFYNDPNRIYETMKNYTRIGLNEVNEFILNFLQKDNYVSIEIVPG